MRQETKCTEEIFLKNVSEHEFTIISDSGINRHLKFMAPDTNNHWFELITWNNHLCISGDMGTYVFARTPDMFNFFRTPAEGLYINTGYWDEKVQSESRFGGGVKKFSEELFKEAIKSDFEAYFEDSEDDKTKAECWEAVEIEVLSCSGEWECVTAANNFSHDDFHFADFWENTVEEYTYHYIWCLRAIVFGIQQYDKSCEREILFRRFDL